MIIKSVSISDAIRRKIEYKHKVNKDEIDYILTNDKPIFIKSRGVYSSIGFKNRYLTIIFDYDNVNKQANVITAYPSSKWQINLYKKMKK